MPLFSASVIADICASPERVSHHYGALRSSFVARLGAAFSAQHEDHLRLAFCSIFAHEAKPYAGATVHDLAGLMAAPGLDCDNYVSLTWHLFRLMRPLSPTAIVALGWDGGAVGNHAQMQGRTAGSPDIYLDPTIGLVVHGCSADALVGDFVFPSNCLVSFFEPAARQALSSFDAQVRDAIQNTRYRVSDLLYWITRHEDLVTMPHRASWLTPRA